MTLSNNDSVRPCAAAAGGVLGPEVPGEAELLGAMSADWLYKAAAAVAAVLLLVSMI